MPRLMDKSLNDYVILMRERYSRMTGKPARSLLLNEFCESTARSERIPCSVLDFPRRSGEN